MITSHKWHSLTHAVVHETLSLRVRFGHFSQYFKFFMSFSVNHTPPVYYTKQHIKLIIFKDMGLCSLCVCVCVCVSMYVLCVCVCVCVCIPYVCVYCVCMYVFYFSLPITQTLCFRNVLMFMPLQRSTCSNCSSYILCTEIHITDVQCFH